MSFIAALWSLRATPNSRAASAVEFAATIPRRLMVLAVALLPRLPQSHSADSARLVAQVDDYVVAELGDLEAGGP